MSQATQPFDVIVIGLGPVGSLASILFSHAGLTVACIEQEPQVYTLPRAVNLDAEILRALQPLDLAEAVNELLQAVRPGERAGFANSNREWLFGNEARPFGSGGWQTMSMFDQPELETFLRNTALQHPLTSDYVGWTAQHPVEETADTVTVTITTDNEQRTLTGRYLVACDGAASPTRKALQIGWQDLGYDHDWLVVDVITKPGHTLGLDTVQVCDPERISTYVCTKDPYRRWEFKLNPGETWEEMLEPEKIHGLIDPWTPRGTYEIRRAAMYQFHAATASTWQVGRQLLAGDAAHQSPPFLGQGMNTGMRDVINLAWKLPLIISGKAAPELLQSYQQERLAHAHDLVEWAVSIGRLMEHLAAVEAAQRDGSPPPAMDPHLQHSGYGQGRGMPPLRAGVVMTEQSSHTAINGFQLNQPIVRPVGGPLIRMDNLLGPGFCLVTNSKDEVVLSAESRKLCERLNIAHLSLEGLAVEQGRIDRAFEHTQTLLVRPDRYIFGHTDSTTSIDDLLDALAAKMHLSSEG